MFLEIEVQKFKKKKKKVESPTSHCPSTHSLTLSTVLIFDGVSNSPLPNSYIWKSLPHYYTAEEASALVGLNPEIIIGSGMGLQSKCILFTESE